MGLESGTPLAILNRSTEEASYERSNRGFDCREDAPILGANLAQMACWCCGFSITYDIDLKRCLRRSEAGIGIHFTAYSCATPVVGAEFTSWLWRLFGVLINIKHIAPIAAQNKTHARRA